MTNTSIEVFTKKELTVDETKFLNLHHQIVESSNLANTYLYSLCKSVKDMHESKLYKAAGFSNFEDYCNDCLSMNRNNAYRYIKIADSFSQDFVSHGIKSKIYHLSHTLPLTFIKKHYM